MSPTGPRRKCATGITAAKRAADENRGAIALNKKGSPALTGAGGHDKIKGNMPSDFLHSGKTTKLMRRVRLAALAMCPLLLGACANGPRTAFTAADQAAAVPLGPRTIRFWADSPGSLFQKAARAAVAKEGQPLIYLALSGGGGGGAYGAGVLNGWSESGSRPEFTVVSGVSTGALIAPFAFLGPAYDARLKKVYTDGEAQSLISDPNPISAIFGGGLFGSERLRQFVERDIDDEMLAAIASEDAKGRRLLVVTTNLDVQRAVIWDIGAIAANGGAKAYKLCRDVLTASASIPVVFAPQLIDVDANGHSFKEMHVDGSVSTPVFTLPDMFLLGGKTIATGPAQPQLYVIVNQRIGPDFEVVPDQTLKIAERSIGTMTRVGTQAALAQTYKFARSKSMGFHLSYIGEDAPKTPGSDFATGTMRDLYAYGHDKARAGSFWETKVPQIETAKEAAKTAER
jgi:hypothetical protein